MPANKKPDHRGRVIRATVKTTATPEQLFEAWADPHKLAQWFPDRAEGRAVEGGIQTWFFDRFNYSLPYEIAAAVPGQLLVFTGEPPGRPRFFLEIEIARHGGSTLLTLTNSGFLDKDDWDDEFAGISSGWQMALATLKLYVEKYYGRPRSQFFAMRPAQYEFGELRPFYRERRLLSRWLTGSGEVGDVGEPYSLELRNGTLASGHVLAVTDWEVQLSWAQIDGCLGLKGFRLGPAARAVCVHGSGWGLPAERAAELEAYFGEALDRLSVLLTEAAARA